MSDTEQSVFVQVSNNHELLIDSRTGVGKDAFIDGVCFDDV